MNAQEKLPVAIVKNTYSVASLYRRVDLLQRFLEHFFFEGTSQDGDRAQLFRSYYREVDADMRHHVAAVAAWDGSVFDSFTAQNLYERIQAIKQAAKDLPHLTLYVPVHLTSMQIEPVGVWCRVYVQPDIMLDLRVDPAAVGGCALAYNDAFHDFSFSYFVTKERSALVKLVHDYGA